ncbi:AbrB/MazE/SpoVT family DNA-binding domain-containing protein [bacterium]|nr:AbrB/MazE/SpoVT family DNA-binding domain-containing protein [bacterium]
MRKKLKSIGNSLGLIIEKPILELLNIDRETELEIMSDGDGLYIKPIRSSHETRIQESTLRLMKKHDETLKKLAE